MTPILYVKPLQLFVRENPRGGSGRIMRMTASYQSIFSNILLLRHMI